MVIGPSLVVSTIMAALAVEMAEKETLAVFVCCSRYTAFFKQFYKSLKTLSTVFSILENIVHVD
jgi:hypothetical protein